LAPSPMKLSTERFCTARATVSPCNTRVANPPGCPARTGGDNWKAVGCASSPADQCIGLVTFGSADPMTAQYIPGCWTINR
jgi:hypothetical protein